jgi:hypothetical protein
MEVLYYTHVNVRDVTWGRAACGVLSREVAVLCVCMYISYSTQVPHYMELKLFVVRENYAACNLMFEISLSMVEHTSNLEVIDLEDNEQNNAMAHRPVH